MHTSLLDTTVAQPFLIFIYNTYSLIFHVIIKNVSATNCLWCLLCGIQPEYMQN